MAGKKEEPGSNGDEGASQEDQNAPGTPDPGIPRTVSERVDFVAKMRALISAGETTESALKSLRGSNAEPSLSRYLEWKDFVEHFNDGLPENRFGRSLRAFGTVISNITSSGLFFMALGGWLIFRAAEQHGGEHTAFTFIQAVLGIAILLFGTGTQSAGRFISNPESNWKFQGSLAGGAGVLAIVFGWALLRGHEEMREAFQAQTQYMVISLQLKDAGTNREMLVQDKFVLQPTRSFTPVPVTAQGTRFELLLAHESHNRPCHIRIRTQLLVLDPQQPGAVDAQHAPLIEHFKVKLPDDETCSAVQTRTEPQAEQAGDRPQESDLGSQPSPLGTIFREVILQKDDARSTDIPRYYADINFPGLVTTAPTAPRVSVVPDVPGASALIEPPQVQFR